jgi:putative uridylyltransferase
MLKNIFFTIFKIEIKMPLDQLMLNLEQFGQQHLLKFWDDLSVVEKEGLTSEIQEIDFENLYKILQDYKSFKILSNENLKPIPARLKGGVETSSEEEIKKYKSVGLKAITDGQVAVLLLAGGQGKLGNFISYLILLLT